jgi:hypothetical protein
MKFYSDAIFIPALSTRYEHQIKPLQDWVKDTLSEHASFSRIRVLDFMPKFFSIWAEEIGPIRKEIWLADPVHIFKKDSSFKIVPFSKIRNEKYHIITAFDVLDHQAEPEKTIKVFSNLCESGGLLLLSLNVGSGFEYQMLGHDSHRLTPPTRLNLLTVEMIESLLKMHDFELIDVSTPGSLDVDIVLKALADSKPRLQSRFISYLLNKRGADTWESFQEFLRNNNLSSYLRIAAKKK